MKKRIVVTVLVLVLVVSAVIGAVLGVQAYQKSQLIASVEYVGSLNWGYSDYGMQSEGIVTNDASQNVYLESGQVVKEIYVTEGQEVKTGDPLMEYDITSQELSVEIKKLEIQTLQNQYTTASAELKKLRNTKPIVPTVIDPGTAGDDLQNDDADWELPSPEKIGQAYQYISDTAIPYNGNDADGTQNAPYRYLCTKDAFVLGSVLNALAENGECSVFEIREGGVPNGALMASWTLNGELLMPDYDEDSRWSILTHTVRTIEDTESENEEDFTMPEEIEEGYTAEELAKAIQQQEQELKRLDLDRRKAELALQELEAQLADGTVYAKVDGTVKTVGDPENPPMDGSPFLEVSGSEGLYVKGAISELQLDDIAVGQAVMADSWETGEMYFGEIASIDNYPSEDLYYYGEQNPNSSLYGYTAYIDDPSGLMVGEYLELTIESTDADNDNGAIYIEQCYVRNEEGRSYVYKDVNGRLQKQYVTTGKMLWGSAIEITSGLTEEDYIAFPYGKTAQEGVKTSLAQ